MVRFTNNYCPKSPPSSIEHGATRPFFHYVVFLMDFSFYYILVFYEGFPHLGVRDHFSIWWINILATIR